MPSPKITFREREEAVHAITERNRHKKRLDAAHEDLENIQERLAAAIRSGDEQEAKRLRRIRQEQEKTFQETRLAITQFNAQVESIKARMREEENAVRRRVDSAQGCRSEWRHAQHLRDLPGLGSGLEPGALLGLLGAMVLFLVAVGVFLLWLK